MIEDRFLTRPLSVVLDFMRFGAALLVVVGHAVQLGLYQGDFPFGVRMQHYCVTVFFVLSGLVISTSVLGGRSSPSRYFVARVSRILPVAIPALLLGTLAAYVLSGPYAVPFDNSPASGLGIVRQTMLPLVFEASTAPVWNPPYWSLCYEVWYYVIFGMAVFLKGASRWVVVAVACLVAGPTMLLLMPVWLLGVGLAHSRVARSVPLALSPLLLVGGLWLALRLFEVDLTFVQVLKAYWPVDPRWSEWAIGDFVMGLIVVVVLAALRPLALALEPQIVRLAGPARTLAGFSFTLYLFHWPLACLALSWGFGGVTSLAGFALVVAALTFSCWVISLITERRTQALRAWMEARMAVPVRQPAQG